MYIESLGSKVIISVVVDEPMATLQERTGGLARPLSSKDFRITALEKACSLEAA